MYLKGCLIVLLTVFLFVFISFNISAADCWGYTGSSDCSADDNCIWQSDEWSGGGWCTELNCWSLYQQDQCTNTTLTAAAGMNCQWKDSNSYGWCEQTSCWSHEGDQTSCESTTDNLNCLWEEECNGWNNEVDCWSFSTSSTCLNVTGCTWGGCHELGCWNYNSNTTCTAGTGGTGGSCKWKTDSWGSWCAGTDCWDYTGTNASACTGNSDSLVCVWVENYYSQGNCEAPACWHYDYTDETACTVTANSTYNITCTWDGQYCSSGGCWNNNAEAGCNAVEGCNWESSTGGGWCEEIGCWSYDSWSGGCS